MVASAIKQMNHENNKQVERISFIKSLYPAMLPIYIQRSKLRCASRKIHILAAINSSNNNNKSGAPVAASKVE